MTHKHKPDTFTPEIELPFLLWYREEGTDPWHVKKNTTFGSGPKSWLELLNNVSIPDNKVFIIINLNKQRHHDLGHTSVIYKKKKAIIRIQKNQCRVLTSSANFHHVYYQNSVKAWRGTPTAEKQIRDKGHFELLKSSDSQSDGTSWFLQWVRSFDPTHH